MSNLKKERIKHFEEEIQNSPNEPFNYYALALEYYTVDSNKTLQLLNFLLHKFPDYLPTYFQLSQLYIELDYEMAKIEEVFLNGIQLAKLKQDFKTLKELQVAYTNWKLSLA